MDTVLTGLRTNGDYHLGNYIGALRPMIDFATNKAADYQINIFAPDLHSFTTPIDHSAFHKQTMDNLRLFVAAGIPLENPNVHMYRQSRIPAHSELTWILMNFTGFGEFNRMVEFKDKSSKLDGDRVSVGLFGYPALMAADILLYGARWVPVGDDQRQHLEFTRTIAERMNNQFGLELVIPESIQKQQEFVGRLDAPRIRSLRNPDKKMSKSIDDPAGTILLTDDPAAAVKKIMSAETDSIGAINLDWDNQPGISNLLTILAYMQGKLVSDIVSQWQGSERYGDLKKAVAAEVSGFLEQLQAQVAKVDDAALISYLERSEAKMNSIASKTLTEVQRAIGLRD